MSKGVLNVTENGECDGKWMLWHHTIQKMHQKRAGKFKFEHAFKKITCSDKFAPGPFAETC